ncbi:MAG: ADYC domain-containing protein [Myxococcota bacterium]
MRVPALTSLALFGAACGGSVATEAPQTQHTTSALTRAQDFGFTGTQTSQVYRYSFDHRMFFRTNYLLNDRLGPVMGLGPNGPSVLGSSLGGISVDGREIAGQEVVGSQFTALNAHGQLVSVRVDAVERGADENDDLLYYRVSHREAEGDWTPLCGDRTAIALPGHWDLSTGEAGDGGWVDDEGFFFACRGSSVAKCYELGFKPWNYRRAGDRLLTQHEACVRALRADYAGTGASRTRDGVELILSSERDAPLAKGYQLEAAWGVDGALCRLVARLPGDAEDDEHLERCSPEHFEDEALLLYSYLRPEHRASTTVLFSRHYPSSRGAFQVEVEDSGEEGRIYHLLQDGEGLRTYPDPRSWLEAVASAFSGSGDIHAEIGRVTGPVAANLSPDGNSVVLTGAVTAPSQIHFGSAPDAAEFQRFLADAAAVPELLLHIRFRSYGPNHEVDYVEGLGFRLEGQVHKRPHDFFAAVGQHLGARYRQRGRGITGSSPTFRAYIFEGRPPALVFSGRNVGGFIRWDFPPDAGPVASELAELIRSALNTDYRLLMQN